MIQAKPTEDESEKGIELKVIRLQPGRKEIRRRILLLVVAIVIVGCVAGTALGILLAQDSRKSQSSSSSVEDIKESNEEDLNLSNASNDEPSASNDPITFTTPSSSPTISPSSSSPTTSPTSSPSSSPTAMPSQSPSSFPSTAPTNPVTYVPGDLTKQEGALLLSTGLTARIIATVGEPVPGTNSTELFHVLPDFGATFLQDDGSFIYVSNSEDRDYQDGGVGAITFDRNYNVIDYKMILTDTTANCGGGKTPWGSWISCEETRWGRAWQVDPTGQREPGVITLGSDYGNFESFAYDIRNLDEPRFFITEDDFRGPIQRFAPDEADWQDPWNILYGNGTIDYLLMYPDVENDYKTGRYEWTTDKTLARDNAAKYYPNCEGIDAAGDQLFFVSKRHKTMMTLDLDGDTYTNRTTRKGLFDGGPDQITRVLADSHDPDTLLYFTEDGGKDPGVHARNVFGQFFTILESPVYTDETTGLSFSPDGTRMYVAYQETGILYEVRREDGYPFHEKNLNVKYHNSPE